MNFRFLQNFPPRFSNTLLPAVRVQNVIKKRASKWRTVGVLVFGLTTFLIALMTATDLRADNDPASRIDRTKLKNSLDQQFSPAWEHIGLRDIVQSLQEVLGVSVILDRRIDPTVERSLKVSSNTLKDCCERLAAECDAGTTVLGSALYFGPKSTAAKLRTLAALRKQELLAMSIPLSRKNRLLIGSSIRWNDLDQPVELLKQIGEAFNLKIEKLEMVPHDAWAGDAVRDVTAIEALTLVLAQFDLTFSWTSEAAGVRVVPIPDVVSIERQYDPPSGASPEIAATRWKEEVTGIETRVTQGKVVVKATEEQQEIVDRLRQGKSKIPQPANPVGKLPPLAQKRYTANIANISVIDLMHTLEQPEQGQLTFEFDEAAFQNAGIDLKRTATFELKSAKIDEMLRKLFGPLGVKYELKDRTVILKPAGP